ncbi:MAG: tetratricopeptide repeat protein [Steroidobacteraceae bacterium]
MQQSRLIAPLALLLLAPLAQAVPDANGNITSTPAPDISTDAAMAARLSYNIGFERFEKARQLEMAGAALKGAQARDNAEAVQQGFTEARERFLTATSADPNMKEAWNLLGYTSRRLGDYEESLAAYDKALALQPDYPEAIEYRAELFLLTGRLDQAKAAYAALLTSSPAYAVVLRQSMQEWVAQPARAPNVAAPERAAFASWVAAL